MPQAIIIGDALSRHGERETIEASSKLRERGVEIAESHLEAGPRPLRKRIRQAVKSGAKLIVVCGGDGTQTRAVAELANTGVTMGVVPAGTGNSFAHSLGITSLEQAFDVIAHGRMVRIDAGRVDGRYFANFATIGLAAEIGLHTPRWLKRAVGAVAYGISAARPILQGKSFRANVRWKKNHLTFDTRQMIIVSGRDFGHTPVTPESSPLSGKLTFFATEESSPVDVLELYAALLAGTQTSLAHAHYFQAKKIKVETSRRVRVAVDGEAICKTPVTFEVAAGALCVMAPEQPAESRS